MHNSDGKQAKSEPVKFYDPWERALAFEGAWENSFAPRMAANDSADNRLNLSKRKSA